MLRNNTSINEIEAPKKIYKEELLSQYNMATSSDNPFVMFIGYYHVIEYFFESVFKEALISQIREEITNPRFSTKRERDIQKIIDLIKQKTKSHISDSQGNEQDALNLTLAKFISLDALQEYLSANKKLDEYYKNNEITFSSGPKFDVNSEDEQKVFKTLASRIYKTRNSLVHSKSNNLSHKIGGSYHPIKHEQELYMEIPLMKYIAEVLIIKNSKNI